MTLAGDVGGASPSTPTAAAASARPSVDVPGGVAAGGRRQLSEEESVEMLLIAFRVRACRARLPLLCEPFMLRSGCRFFAWVSRPPTSMCASLPGGAVPRRGARAGTA